MSFRTAVSRAGTVLVTGLVAVGALAAPATAEEQAVVDVLKVVDGEYVVETVRVPVRTAEATAEDLEDRADVVVASPSVTYQLDGTPDPYWDTQDPQHTSAVREVWPRTRGEGQVVAVLDTAAAIEHEDLTGAVLPGVDLTDGSGSPWHGEGVAGVIAARVDNGTGSAGMAPAAKVVPVKVCADGGCPSGSIARGILWAADRGVDVINMSLSGAGYSDVSAAAVAYALDKGISVVASAGNDGLNGNPVMYPAALSGVIGVSATTPAGAPSDWAVHGWQVDVSTVGESVLLTTGTSSYANGSGTSFSGPAVAGAVALLRSARPGISPREVQAALQAGSDSSGTWNRAYGAGRLDVPAAVAAADRADGGVVVTGSGGSVDVSWDAVPGATSYTVRVDGVVRAQVPGTSTRITGLTDGNQVAVDVQADDGPRSKPALATVVASTPVAPALHSATLGGTSSSATVTLSASVSGAAASKYSIIRDGVSMGTITWTLTGTPSSKTIGIGAMPTTQTRWQLRPVDTYAQLLPASNVVTTGSSLPAAPVAPTGLAGRLQNGDVLLSWDDPGSAYTYRVSVEASLVATPSTAGVTLPAPPVGSSRTYDVAVVDGWGRSGPAASVTVTHERTAPAAPQLRSVTPGSQSATLRWAAPLDDGASPVTGYTVHALQGETVVQTRSVSADQGSATISSLTNGVAYRFTVSATNAVGTGAEATSGDVVPVGPPGLPTVGSLSPGDGSVLVRWTAPSNTGGSPITGYSVRVVQGGSVVRTVTTDGPVTSTTVTGLTNGTAYAFSVAATNAAGTGWFSPTSAAVTPSAATTAPGAPGIGFPYPGNASVLVRWTAPASDGGSPITGYTVQVHRDGVVVQTWPASADATSATVTGLTNGVAYRFTVTATNAVGTSSASALSSSTTPSAPVTLPGAPTIGTATAGSGYVLVHWTPPADDGGSTISAYVLTAQPADGGASTSATAPGSATSAYVHGLTNGRSYTVTVAARNAAGTGAASAASAAVTPRGAPGAPVIGSVTAADGAAQVHWSAPADDGGSPVAGYSVMAWTGDDVTAFTTAGGDATSATVAGLTNGVTYSFTVIASNALGAGPSSEHSDPVTPAGSSAPGTVTPPAAPGIGTPTTYKALARVRWTTPAADGGAPITGYQVRAYRGSTLVGAITAPAGATSAVVTGLTLGRAHSFTVAAVNSAGTGNWSERSATVTPRTTPGAPRIGTARPARKAVVVSWTAPATNGGAAITRYVVRTYSGGKLVKATTAKGTARSVAVTKLVPGRSYTFRVQALTVVGGGAWSAASKVAKPKR